MENRIIKRLFEVFGHLKIKNTEVATLIQKSPVMISEWKSGKSKPSIYDFEVIANHYSVNLNWLICGNGQMLNNRAIDEVEKANNITERLIINQEKLVDTNAQLVESNSQLVNMNIDYYKLIKELISTKEKK